MLKTAPVSLPPQPPPPVAPPGPPVNVPFVRFAWSVLAYNVAIVVWGAYVRASGSGAGCGNHWPLCNGELVLHSRALTTLIEFTHRSTSGIDVALVGFLLVWAFRSFPARNPVRRGAVLSTIFLITEALIGASLVLLGQVANNASPARAWWLSGHLLNTLTLLACLTLTAWWASGKPDLRLRGRAAWMAAVSVAVFVLLGITGVIAALADTLFPATSLASGLAQDWTSGANLFLRLRGLHPLIAAAAAAWLLYYALATGTARPEVRPRAWLVAAAVAVQLAAGAINLLLLAPVWMQLVHLLVADLLWIALVVLSAETLGTSS